MNGKLRPAVPVDDRRQFLRTVAGGVGAALAAPPILAFPSAAVGAEPQWKMRLATSSIHFLHLPIEQACRRIAALGFEAIDIWSAHAGCPHLDDAGQRLGPDGLAQLLAQSKLRLCSFSVYSGGYPRYAELLGGVGGGLAVRDSAPPCPPDQITARMRQFLEDLKPQLELAEKYNSYLAIENHGHALVDSLDSLKAFVDLNRSPRLGLALAPYHLQAMGAPVAEAIAICGRQLFFFYAWQRADGAGQLPGRGPTDFAPWITALAKARYGGYVNPFMHGDVEPDEMARALAGAKDYLVQCDDKRKAAR